MSDLWAITAACFLGGFLVGALPGLYMLAGCWMTRWRRTNSAGIDGVQDGSPQQSQQGKEDTK